MIALETGRDEKVAFLHGFPKGFGIVPTIEQNMSFGTSDRKLLSLVASATCRNSPPAFVSLCRASTPTVGSQSTDYNVKQFFYYKDKS